MKKTVKILTLCAVMMFAMSFSAFSATKSEKADSLKLKNGTVVKIEKDSNGKIESVQFPDGKKIEFKNFQSAFYAAKAKCLSEANASTVDACTDAKVIAGLAVVGATVACVTTAGIACVIASAAAMQAIKMMSDACGGGKADQLAPCSEEMAENRKFLIKEKTNFNFSRLRS